MALIRLTGLAMNSFIPLAMTINPFVTLAIIRTAARRNARRTRLAMSTDAEFTVAVETKAIPDMRAKADGDE
jgi:hypothetical protein